MVCPHPSLLRVVRHAALVVFLPVAAAAAPIEARASRLTDVAVATEGDATVVRLKVSASPRYHASLIDTPDRLVVDLEGTTYGWRKTPLDGVPAPLKQVRGSQFRKDIARVVIELKRRVPYSIDETPDGLLVKVGGAATEPPREIAGVEVRRAVAKPKISVLPVVAATPVAPGTPRPADREPAAADATRPAAIRASTDAAPAAVREARAPEPAPPAPTDRLPAEKSGSARPEPIATAQASPASAPVAPTPAPPTAAEPRPRPAAPGERLVSLDFKDADVVNILRILAAESGRNIVIGEDVKGKMSIALRNVPWEVALETILETRGLQRVEKNGTIRIVSTEQLTKEREAKARIEEAKLKSEAEVRAKIAEAQLKEAEAQNRKLAADAAAKEAEARGPLKEDTIRLLYADPEEVAKTLQGILGIPAEGAAVRGPGFVTGSPVNGPIAEPPFSQLFGQQPPPPPAPISVSQDVLAKGLTIRAHKPTNTLFLRLYAADLDRVKKLIREALDVPLPQVKIEARMEILDRNALEQIGVQWGGMFAQKSGTNTLVGQGLQTTTVGGQSVPFVPGMVSGNTNVVDQTPPSDHNPRNPFFTLFPAKDDSSGGMPVSFQTGLPLGGNLVNLPISALPNAGPLPAAGLAFGIIGTNFNVNLALQALAEQGKTRTLARPEIVTVENNKASMSLGEEIPYATISSAGTQIQFKEALLKLEVVPTVIREGDQTRIKLIVVVENNSRGSVVNLGSAGQPPAINRRKAETQVLVKEGERLVIGGVTTSTNQNTSRKVPVFGDIPLLGWLFKQRENFEVGRELVVFITPSVLRAPVAGATPPAK